MRFFILLSGVLLLFSHCKTHAYADTNRDHRRRVDSLTKVLRQNPARQTLHTAAPWVGTTNFGIRKPNIVVIHHTAQDSCGQTLRTFTLPRTAVSAHYVICKDGTVHHMLNDYLRAQHAGLGSWGGATDVNSASIGIELDNNGRDSFDLRQIGSLLTLLDTLKRKYSIPTPNFIAHADLAPTRKNDPNVTFPWKALASRGFGRWWRDTTGVQVPPGFDHLLGLRALGYDVSDTAATFAAFNRRYLMQHPAPRFGPESRKVLYALCY